MLRDLGSTNGTYVNGQRITAPVALHEDDLVQFANMAFRVRQQAAARQSHTVQENACDRALALVQFDKLMAEHAVTPFFQPIVSMADQGGRRLRSPGPQPAVRAGDAQGDVPAWPRN